MPTEHDSESPTKGPSRFASAAGSKPAVLLEYRRLLDRRTKLMEELGVVEPLMNALADDLSDAALPEASSSRTVWVSLWPRYNALDRARLYETMINEGRWDEIDPDSLKWTLRTLSEESRKNFDEAADNGWTGLAAEDADDALDMLFKALKGTGTKGGTRRSRQKWIEESPGPVTLDQRLKHDHPQSQADLAFIYLSCEKRARGHYRPPDPETGRKPEDVKRDLIKDEFLTETERGLDAYERKLTNEPLDPAQRSRAALAYWDQAELIIRRCEDATRDDAVEQPLWGRLTKRKIRFALGLSDRGRRAKAAQRTKAYT